MGYRYASFSDTTTDMIYEVSELPTRYETLTGIGVGCSIIHRSTGIGYDNVIPYWYIYGIFYFLFHLPSYPRCTHARGYRRDRRERAGSFIHRPGANNNSSAHINLLTYRRLLGTPPWARWSTLWRYMNWCQAHVKHPSALLLIGWSIIMCTTLD